VHHSFYTIIRNWQRTFDEALAHKMRVVGKAGDSNLSAEEASRDF
jgi:hypothetical protein